MCAIMRAIVRFFAVAFVAEVIIRAHHALPAVPRDRLAILNRSVSANLQGWMGGAFKRTLHPSQNTFVCKTGASSSTEPFDVLTTGGNSETEGVGAGVAFGVRTASFFASSVLRSSEAFS